MAWSPSRRPRTDTLGRRFTDRENAGSALSKKRQSHRAASPCIWTLDWPPRFSPISRGYCLPCSWLRWLANHRLVGMECPGLHSIFSGLDLTFFAGRRGVPELNYRVADGRNGWPCFRWMSKLRG